MNEILKKTNFVKILSFGLIALIISLPFADHTRFSLFINRFLLIRLVLLALFSISALVLIRRYLKEGWSLLKNDLKNLTNDPYLLILIALLLVRILSLVNSLNLKASLNLILFFVSMVLLYVLVRFITNNLRFYIFKMVRFYVYTGVLAVLYGLTQLLFYLKGINLPGVLVGGDFIRLPGTFYDANHFPAYLTTIAPLLIGFAWLSERRFFKILWWLIFLILAIVVLFTFSRSGVISLGVASLIFLVYATRMGFIKKIVPLLLIILTLAVVVLLSDRTPISLIDRAKSVLDSREKSTVAHTLLIQGELDLFRSNPILGVGYGSFSEHFRATSIGKEHLKIDPTAEIRLPAHSVWFEVITETGVSGLILYASFMVLVLAGLVNTITKVPNKTARIYGMGLFSGIVGLLTGGLFYSYNLEFFWLYLFLGIAYAGSINVLFKEKVLFAEEEKPEKINWSGFLIPGIVLAIAAFLIFFKLGESHLIDWDEAIYAGISKNLSQNWDFLGLTWNGMFWFEKPPLYIWLTSFMVHFYGVNSFAARFFSALFGVGGVAITYFLAQKMYNRFVGFVAGLILATSFHYVYYARNGMLDVTVTFFMVLTALFFWLGKEKPKYFALSGVALGLGVLTKGPVALLIIPAMVFTPLLFDFKNIKKYLTKFSFLGGVLFLAVVLPWHILEYFRFGKAFIDNYLLYHVLARAGSSIEGKSADTWVYIAVIRNSFRIWFIPFLPALFFGLWEIIKRRKEMIFLFLWAATIFVSFTLSQSKLIWYLIPIYPSLAIITARFLERVLVFVVSLLDRLISIPLKFYQMLFALILASVSLTYVYFNWAKIQPRDFNFDQVKLIGEKQRLEKTNRVGLIMAGFHPPVPLYYAEGRVSFVPNENLMGVLTNSEPNYAITTADNAQKIVAELKSKDVDVNIVSVSGDLALIFKP